MATIVVLTSEQRPAIVALVERRLRQEGHCIQHCTQAEEAISSILRVPPQLVVLAVATELDYQLIQIIREHPKSAHITLIAIVSTSHEMIRVLNAGADHALLRSQTEATLATTLRSLRRLQEYSLSALTALPSGHQVEHAITHTLIQKDVWSILYLDLDHFKAFNDAYGFLCGNSMIRLLGTICREVVEKYGNFDDFVGHIGGDDFIIITSPDRASLLGTHIQHRYRQESSSLYSQQDLAHGAILRTNGKGMACQFPLVTLSIGIICHQDGSQHTLNEISELAAEAKKMPNKIWYLVYLTIP